MEENPLSIENCISTLRNAQNDIKDFSQFCVTIQKVIAVITSSNDKKLRDRLWTFLCASTSAYDKRGRVDSEIYEKLIDICVSKETYWSRKQLEILLQWKVKNFHSLNKEKENTRLKPLDHWPRRLRMAETVLNQRSNRILIVLERTYDYFNQKAVLRTAECFGIQNVWIIEPVETKNAEKGKKITKGTENFLTLQFFKTTSECISALKQDGREIWATDLSPTALSLEDPKLVVPPKVAIVFGREAEGCTTEILESANSRVYLPLHGFAESLNLSVAAALIIQRVLHMCPEARGDLTDGEKATLRKEWYGILGEKSERRQEEYLGHVDEPPLDVLEKDEDSNSSHVPKKIKRQIMEKEKHDEGEHQEKRMKK